MDMEQRDGRWRTTVEVTAPTQTDLRKRVAAVNRVLAKAEKEKKPPRRKNGEGTIFTRGQDGIVGGQVELPRGPDGKRRRSKPVYGKNEAEVIVKLQKLKADLAKGLEQLDQTVTVAAWLEHWLEEIAPGKVKPHALGGYRSAVKRRIVPAIGPERLAKLKPAHVRQMHKWIRQATYTRGGEQVPYSTRAVEEAHNVLSSALTDAVTEGVAHRNVCELVAKPSVVSESHGALTSDEARAVLLAALAEKDELVTRWTAGLMLGGRQGELLGLQWDRVDLARGTLDLAWQLEWLELKDGAAVDDPKRFAVEAGFEHVPLWRGAALTRPKSSLSTRMIPLPEPLAAILTVYREHWVPNPWNLVWTHEHRGGKFKGQRTPIGDSVDRKGWRAAQKRAKVAEPVDVHAMRGTTATLLMEAGVPDKVIQSILGHASVLTTRGYQRVDQTLQRKALGNLDGLLRLD
ncbi:MULTISPECIES: tyrosine-type recombinase/integrase [Nocardia]|uniref:tyrosine-type recombinase/integrase n=1 Tax=Nocardia TaxID=1817 RepID=UPI002455B410|nr:MULTISPECIES: site-specific integrase [Nocardia]